MSPKFQKGASMPTSIGLCADEYHEVREMRLAMQKEVDAVAERERELRDYIINNLSKSDDTGAAGKRYRAQVIVKVVPKTDDWNALHAYVQETGRFDLLQKRLSDTAVKAMWDNGEAVPGVGTFNQIDVSITKIK